MPVVDLGEGAHELLAAPCRGRVLAVYRRAAYLRLDGAIVALTDPAVAAGPLHVRCTALPRLREGSGVGGDGVRLAGEGWAVRVDGPVWRGALPAPDDLVDDLGPARVDAAVRDLVRAGHLEELAAAVGGRGPGLTPAGDDLLAGVLVVARLCWGPGSEPRLDAVARGVATTAIARAFLVQAARGRCLAPVHEWLTAASAGRHDDAERARRTLVSVGASSGERLAAGLAVAVAQLPRRPSQSARAGPGPLLRHRAGRSPG